MSIRGRIVKLEQRRRGPVTWTNCRDPIHLPPDPMAGPRRDYRDALAGVPTTEDGVDRVALPSGPICPTCDEPADGLYVEWRNYYALRGDEGGAA